MFGHAGRVLRVDLGSSDITVERLNGALARKYVGGSGLGTYYLNKETNPLSRPLGPENALILLTGPFAGTRLPTSARLAVVTKSPLTGMYAESDVGGTFGLKLKRSGF
ncbi:MAG TPA: aldehyde ferredoxin oxidoreductase, partial [Firmicutes bacterium]|nr:aldehyde ferredoxin oxidoreductase [Bacillota bacterium]